jgi:hypothetical protein
MNEWRSGRIFSLMTCLFISLIFFSKPLLYILVIYDMPGLSFFAAAAIGFLFCPDVLCIPPNPFYVLVFFFKIVATLRAARKRNC